MNQKAVARYLMVLGLLAGGWSSVALAGDPKDLRRYNLIAVPKIAVAPKIDGLVEKREWYGASMLPRLIRAGKGTTSEECVRLYLCHDTNAVYIAFQIDRPDNALAPQPEDVVKLAFDAAHTHKTAVVLGGNVESKASGPAGVQWQFKAHPADFG